MGNRSATNGSDDGFSRRERSRASVEQTALALFRSRGYDAVTVEDISAAAGIGPATFYRYFGSKKGVLFAYQPLLLSGIREATERMDVTRRRPDQLLEVVTRFAAHLAAQEKAMAARDEIVAANPGLLPHTLAVQRDWETHLTQHLTKRRGLPEPDLAARTDAALILVIVRLAFRQWRAGRSPGLGEAVDVAFAEVCRALDETPSGCAPAPDGH